MESEPRKSRNIKHKHGTPNPIILAEEEMMLAMIDKALASSTNAQTIGRNGEIPLRDFFNRYLPYTFRAVTGHFVTPNGFLSPQIDVMILDSRYPLLAQNADGSVLAMLHSLIIAIEVKTRIATRDIEKLWNDSIEIARLADEVETYSSGEWGSVSTEVFAYRSAQGLDALEAKYIELCKPKSSWLDIHILRLPYEDFPKTIGFELHYEPIFDDGEEDIRNKQDGEEEKEDIEGEINKVTDYIPTTRPYYNGLSDMYYRLVQNAYYTLAARDYSFGDIGEQIMSYMSWSTYREGM